MAAEQGATIENVIRRVRSSYVVAPSMPDWQHPDSLLPLLVLLLANVPGKTRIHSVTSEISPQSDFLPDFTIHGGGTANLLTSLMHQDQYHISTF